MMASACFGPPPLPPNKRAVSQQSAPKLSSTYMSFRDPADELSRPDVLQTFQSHPQNPVEQHCCSRYRKDVKSASFRARRNVTNEFVPIPIRTSMEPCCRHNRNRRQKLNEAEVNTHFSQQVNHSNVGFAVLRDPQIAQNARTNSLRRSLRQEAPKLSLISRWRSEGNLAQLDDSADSTTSLPASGRLEKCMKALSGSLKNLLQLGGMSRPAKVAPQAKRVAPPAVPDLYRLSGSSFGSAGYASAEEAVFLAPDTPTPIRDDHSDYGSTASGGTQPGKSPGIPGYGQTGPGGQQGPAFSFPPQVVPSGGPPTLTHKAAVYYHHQLALQEDQGIDMTQSPGRDSPGSSSGSAGSGSRHSTASLDSGRASGYLGAPRSTLGSASSPRCSLSSCSLGSEHGRYERMILQGAPDQDVIMAWLSELQYEEYSPLFSLAGYDLATVARMTPEDLTAIGIKKPNHRKRLKAEIQQLVLPDNLPDYIPGSIEEWLRLLRLDEYAPALISQGYKTVQDVTQLTWEDLEETGIVRLGHQKKIMLAIKRVKDVQAGKRFSGHTGQCSSNAAASQDGIGSPSCGSVLSTEDPVYVHTMRHAYQHPWEVQQSRMMSASCHPVQQNCYVGYGMNDIVPIQIRQGRGKSLESLEDTERGPVTHLTFSNETGPQALYVSGGGQGMPSSIMLTGGQQWRRSYDDGDITPTNEASILASYEGGGTLPRPRGFVRPRPVAKVTGNTKSVPAAHFQDFNEKIPYNQQQQAYNEYMQYATSASKYSHLYSPHLTKKMPPQPPKRQSSNSGLDGIYSVGSVHQTTVEIHAENISPPNKSLPSLHEREPNKTLPLSLPAYPSSDSLSCVSLESEGLPLPPPPAPCTPPTGIMPSRSWTDGSASRMNEEQMLINTLANQARNGSDASFKSSSSTESDSLPFANENAGTIKQRANAGMNRNQGTLEFSRTNSLSRQSSHLRDSHANSASDITSLAAHESTEPADVLSDIGNMLANLTDELDAMLEEEKRQGLTDSQ